MNIANKLTVFRVILVPFFVFFMLTEFTDYNSSSAVCMLNFSGKSVFLPGDSKMGVIDGGKFMCKAYSTKTFGCDIMQVSHHGYN